MRWDDLNPQTTATGFRGIRQGLQAEGLTFGRQMFASNFAGGGISSAIFGAGPKDIWKYAYTPNAIKDARKGARLARLQQLHPGDKGIAKAVAAHAKEGKSVLGRVGGAFKGAGFSALITAGFTIGTMAMTEGSLEDKGIAGVETLAGTALSIPGSTLGMAVGGTIGSVIPVFGTAVGMAAGWLIGGMVGWEAGALIGKPLRYFQRKRDAEINRRRLGWVGNTAAFQTQSAWTMRQRSLEAMNSGQASARSLLGREATFLHT
jgi:phage tail tape-measure protein